MLHCPTCGKDFPADLKTCPQDNTLLQADATSVSEAPVDPLLGRTLDDKYLLEARLGIGGMGTVYRARHLLIDRGVAVKVLNSRFVEDEAAKARFRREAKAAAPATHQRRRRDGFWSNSRWLRLHRDGIARRQNLARFAFQGSSSGRCPVCGDYDPGVVGRGGSA